MVRVGNWVSLLGGGLVGVWLVPGLAQAQITPAMPAPVYSNPTLATGVTGGNGNDADCSKAWEGEGKPNDGSIGGAGQSYSATYTDAIAGSAYGTGVILNSVGGQGGQGGSGESCYGGRGGGQGGAGGSFTITYGSGGTNTPAMTIAGSGVLATSQGGNGGNGGGTSNSTGAGNGGVGGNGGTISLSNYSGSISTTGNYAFGLYGLSMGGNGGKGGSNGNGVYGPGGSGAYGGLGGQVTIVNYGTITTINAYNMLGISVGGYGGNSGSGSGFVPSPSGASGGGGPGGNVTLTNYGTMSTSGLGQASMVALSVGGGGGDAGRSSSLVALGNTGGQGAYGGVLALTNTGTIQTFGAQSTGLLGLAIGGGGGTGGMASSSLIGGGGSGGGGGPGGSIYVLNTGFICTGGGCQATTAPASGGVAPAIAALSVGGGGGMGGYAISQGSTASIAIGGAGGSGGAGGLAIVNNTNTLRTTEVSSPAIFAASVGGGGGHGGGTFSASAGLNTAFSMAVGGSGGSGGGGGSVGVNCGQAGSNSTINSACGGSTMGAAITNSTVTTYGGHSPAFVGLSVGGGGGWGGMAVSLAGGTGFSGSVSVGGSGGSGGAGGPVYVATGGVNTVTSGDLSAGVVALSVGGGGGRGGITFYTPDYTPGGAVAAASGSISVGGTGGNGGAGGSVIAENLGALIKTNGDRATGVFAASVGGRGGHGGLAAGGAAGAAFAFSTSVGGNGGSGNAGGAVTVNNFYLSQAMQALIQTYGADAHAVEAVSVGGGGGSGGWSAGAGVSLGPTTSLTVGGNGGSGGNGGPVSVLFEGTAQTFGRGSAGILAMSVAGGGGNGGSSAASDVALNGAFTATVGGTGNGGGVGGPVSVTNYGYVLTGLAVAANPMDPARAGQGILAISVGGGGGRGGIAVGANLTGSGSISDVVGGGAGNGGTGGAVSVYTYGVVNSYGDLSNAVTGISVGGRGGLGGIAISGGISTGTPMTMTLGSNGGNGGRGGNVVVDNFGAITSGGFTVPGSSGIVGGFRSMGLVAQSVGGHGGMGGISIGSTLGTPMSTSASLTLGGSGGGGGVGGSAFGYNDWAGSIATNGPFAAGLVAQSLGGNGGIGGFGGSASTTMISPSMTLGGNGGNGAIGGSATATNYGKITTQGLHSIGLLAQSIGGNGGMSGATIAAGSADRAAQANLVLGNTAGTGGNGGAATANLDGVLSTTGPLSTGIAAESIGGGGGRAGVAFDLSVMNASDAVNHSVQMGSQGGAGGNGGAANILAVGVVTTSGYQSDALYAGSIGGGGGSSGLSFLNLTLGSKTIDLSVGGRNGAAGSGGSATLSANQNISAWDQSKYFQGAGVFSHAVFAQSVGGGGGSATGLHTQPTASGLAQGLLSLGGTGGSSGDGGGVWIATGGQIFTYGVASVGVFGQSVGGGGGQGLSGLIVANATASIPDTPIQLTAGSQTATSSNGSSGSSASGPSATLSLSGSTSTSVGTASSMSLGGFSTSRANGGTVNISALSFIVSAGLMSDAVKAQSIGGGGGFSGFADIYSGSPFAASTISLGGGNGGGGSGNTVNVTTAGAFYTEGSLSIGLLAQSVSSGGDARHVSLGPVRTAFASVLGDKAGAAGGTGGNVTVTNSAAISTYGYGSDALVAQSIGGGGGLSGLFGSSAIAPSFATNATTAGAQAGLVYQVDGGNEAYAGLPSGQSNGGAAVSTNIGLSMGAMLGASGSSGAYANTVNVINGNNLTTGGVPGYGPGDGSVALIAQGIGAGGGIARQHTINFDQSQISMGLTLGATNNANGDGGAVTIWNNTSGATAITTSGRGSMGLLAQSIGGGGGLGLLTAGTSGAGGSAAIAMTLGTTGTASGYGHAVNVNTAASITTYGAQAEGIVAQSIGNGGGVGKAAIYSGVTGTNRGSTGNSAYADAGRTYAYAISGLDAGIHLGSYATGGSNADAVAISSSSTITTSGLRSTGIVAQSIAGGGGLVDITAEALNGGNLNANFLLGGYAASNPGAVAITTYSGIFTSGDLADGILAQAIAGGGGSVGLSQIGTTSAGAGTMTFNLGSGAQYYGTNAAPVTIVTNNWVSTLGFGASGITAQSIGGGGGLLSYLTSSNTTGLNITGGWMGEAALNYYGNGGTVNVTNSYMLSTGSTASFTASQFGHGIVAQSIGGGGGRVVGSPATSSVVMGANGTGGNGGPVTVTSYGQIWTHGNYSHGIIAQSIGGGGGLLDVQGTSVRFGAPNGSGASAPVVVNVDAPLWTYGSNSIGVVAQSIAGGGGLAVASDAVSFGATQNASGHDSNSATVNVNSTITTYGNTSPAIVAYAVGGGGGVAFVNSINQPVTTYHGSGTGGTITVNVNQSVYTYGTNSYGVMAGSFGGGGGILIGNDGVRAITGRGAGGGSGTHVNIKSGVNVFAYGASSTAVWQVNSSGQNDPEVNIEKGASVMGGPGGRGIYLSGAFNSVNNYGTLGTFDGVNGIALVTEPGLEPMTTTVINGGRLTGSVQLGAGQNVFNNLAGGVVVAGSVLDLSSTGVFNNAGVLQAGGGVVGNTTVVTGTLNQAQGGSIQAAVGPGGQSSHLVVNGNATLGGQLGIVFANNVVITPGAFNNASVVTVSGTLTNAGLSANSTAMVQNELTFNGNSIGLQGNVTFTPNGLSAEGVRFGQALALYQANGSSPLMNAIVHDLVQVLTLSQLERSYADVAGGSVSAVVQTGLQTAQGGMMSFAEQADRWRAGPSRPEDKLWQMWIAPFAAYSNVGASTGGMNANFFGASAGVDMQVMGDTLIGIGVAGSQNRVNVATSSMSANQGAGGAGLYALQRFGQAYVSASSYIGMDHTQFNRRFMDAGSANASFNAKLAGFQLEAGYTMPFQRFALTPFAAFAPVWRWQNGTTETAYYSGLAGAGLVFASQTSSSLPLILGVQLERNMKLSDGSVVSAFLRAGWVHEFNTNRALTKNLPGLAAASFTTGGDYAFPNAALVRLSAQYKLTEQMSFFADVNSLLATQGVTLGGQIGMQVKW